MKFSLSYPNRDELADAIKLTSLQPRDTFFVVTEEDGMKRLIFVDEGPGSIVAHTSDGRRASINLHTLELEISESRTQGLRR